MFSMTSVFVNLSETMAETGFLVSICWWQPCCASQWLPDHAAPQVLLREATLLPPGKCQLYITVQALAAAIVAFTFLYFRRQYTISPEAVYRQAMIRLNTSPGVLEVRLPCRASAARRCLLKCCWAD